MHWILQNNIFKESAYEELLRILEKLELPHSVHKVIPFVGELEPAPQLSTHKVICMGSYSMRNYAAKHGWIPGVYDLEKYDFPMQLHKWGNHMLNSNAIVTKFKDVSFPGDQCFIRPIEDSKVFAGQVMSWPDFSDWQKKVCELGEDYGTTLTGDTIVQVCSLKDIYTETRFWVVGGKIVTSSIYKIGQNVKYEVPPLDNHVQRFAQDRVDEWQPLDAFVIDIADTSEGLKIVEINTINSCGFYAANMMKLVIALEDLNA